MLKEELKNKAVQAAPKVKKEVKKEYELLSKGQWIPVSAEDLGDSLQSGLDKGDVRHAK